MHHYKKQGLFVITYGPQREKSVFGVLDQYNLN